MTNSTALWTRTVNAAGCVLWRRQQGELQVAMVHRQRYDDWSWAKGKLDPGETWVGAAAREVLEETGLQVQVGIPLPTSVYPLARAGRKEVRYWAARVVGGNGELEHEIDQVAWLSAGVARRRLSYERDTLQLQAVLDADRRGTLDTWPLVIVRHGDSVARGSWKHLDHARPLDDSGEAQASALVDVLAAYDIRRVVSSDATRCLTTIEPYAVRAGLEVRAKSGLSEEGHEREPKKALHHIDRALNRAQPAAICSHRPVLPALFGRLLEHTSEGTVSRALETLVSNGIGKGDAVVCQMAGVGERAVVASVELHPGRR